MERPLLLFIIIIIIILIILTLADPLAYMHAGHHYMEFYTLDTVHYDSL